MRDMIYRQDAIEVADAVWSVTGDKNVAKVWDQINDLPSAQPDLSGYSDKLWRNAYERGKAEAEHKTGRWIYGEHDIAMCDGYWCNKCGFFVPWDYKHKFIDFIKDYHWCPNCGARMEVEHEG